MTIRQKWVCGGIMQKRLHYVSKCGHGITNKMFFFQQNRDLNMDFCLKLRIQIPWQLWYMLKWGHNGEIYMDTTFKTNDLKFYKWTLVEFQLFMYNIRNFFHKCFFNTCGIVFNHGMYLKIGRRPFFLKFKIWHYPRKYSTTWKKSCILNLSMERT
jgi:hypothetical protein